MVAEGPGDGPESDAGPPDGDGGRREGTDVAPGAATPADAAAGVAAGPAGLLAERLDGASGTLATRFADRLEEDEVVRVAWTVERDDPRRGFGPDRRTLYVATDRRLLAVESGGPVRSTAFAGRSVADPALTLGAGVVVAVLSFLGGVAAASGWTALLLVLACVGGLALAERGWRGWRVGDDHDPPETAVSSVVVRGTPAGVDSEAGREGDVAAAGGEAEGGAVAEAGPTVVAFDVGGVPVPSAVVDGEEGDAVAESAGNDG